MTVTIKQYEPTDATVWDAFLSTCSSATFLHSRKFLSYHGNRFDDASVLILDDGVLVGVLPAARSPAETNRVISHPGSTYGGIVHRGRLLGNRMLGALDAVLAHYRAAGYLWLEYKVVPYIYSVSPAQDDLYALHRYGARRVRCDLSCAIDLENRGIISTRRRRALKKALSNVTLSNSPYLIGELWETIAENLRRKHSTSPVHSLEELRYLQTLFPNEITILCALVDARVEAGIVMFSSHAVCHAQYIAASEHAYEISALDAVFDHAVSAAYTAGKRYFDFGTSNEDRGMILNDGLYRFKSEFGASGVAYEYYEIDLA